MAEYPNAIKNFLQLEDGVDTVIALHPNERGDEITAIETELGTNPKGAAADVAARLAAALHDDGTLKNVYDSDWFAVGLNTTYQKNHDLNTVNFLHILLFNSTASDTNAQIISSNVAKTNPDNNECASVGIRIDDVDNVSLHTGEQACAFTMNFSDGEPVYSTSGYMRLIIIAL